MEDNHGEGSRADPLCEVGLRLDHGEVTRGRVWLWVVGAVGVLALVYALALQIVRRNRHSRFWFWHQAMCE